ncbi:SDR family oxidoreductase [Cupriavidus basilensis]
MRIGCNPRLPLSHRIKRVMPPMRARKHAVTLATRLRAATWGSAGVRLNAVAPGAVQTPLLEAGLTDPRYAEAIRNYVAPLGRRAQADEVAAPDQFCVRRNSGFHSRQRPLHRWAGWMPRGVPVNF